MALRRKRVLVPKEALPLDAPMRGSELRAWRVKVGMSRKEAAKYLGFSWRTIENWENERRPVAHPRGLRTMMDLMSKRLGL